MVPDRYDALQALLFLGFRSSSWLGAMPVAWQQGRLPVPRTASLALTRSRRFALHGCAFDGYAQRPTHEHLTGHRQFVGQVRFEPTLSLGDACRRRMPRRGGDQCAVRAFVLSGHSVRGEAFLEAGAYFSSVEPAQIAHGPDSLLFVLDDEARHAVLDDLGHGAGAVGDHWRPTGHRLDHDEAERFRPIDRKQQGRGLGEERLLPHLVHLADKLDRPAVDVGLKLLLEVDGLAARNLGGNAQGHSGGARFRENGTGVVLLRFS
jgi:hypothetical protein